MYSEINSSIKCRFIFPTDRTIELFKCASRCLCLAKSFHQFNYVIHGAFFQTKIIITFLCGDECWATKKKKEANVSEICMLRWICGVTRDNIIKNDYT